VGYHSPAATVDQNVHGAPRKRHGAPRHAGYDPADFGLDRAERRAALRFYTDRFRVTAEP